MSSPTPLRPARRERRVTSKVLENGLLHSVSNDFSLISLQANEAAEAAVRREAIAQRSIEAQKKKAIKKAQALERAIFNKEQENLGTEYFVTYPVHLKSLISSQCLRLACKALSLRPLVDVDRL